MTQSNLSRTRESVRKSGRLLFSIAIDEIPRFRRTIRSRCSLRISEGRLAVNVLDQTPAIGFWLRRAMLRMPSGHGDLSMIRNRRSKCHTRVSVTAAGVSDVTNSDFKMQSVRPSDAHLARQAFPKPGQPSGQPVTSAHSTTKDLALLDAI